MEKNITAQKLIMLHPLHQRKAITKEAIKKVPKYGFITLKIHSAQSNTNAENRASQKLLESLRFSKGGSVQKELLLQ